MRGSQATSARMKDPATLAYAVGGGATATSLGYFAGIPVDALLFGLMGGVVAVAVIPPKRKPSAKEGPMLYLALALSVLVSVLVAAAMGPLTAAYLHFQRVDPVIELRAFSFLWAAGAQAGLLLSAIEALRRRIDQLGGKS